MDAVKHDEIRQAVRQQYGQVADSGGTGCGCGPSCCDTPAASAETVSQGLGYSADDVVAVPQGANLGLGCGNPQAIAALKPGETVLDLGSGAGFDCFLAARANAAKGGYANTEFRLGEIEHLPVADASVDAIISNCVINLSPDKAQVFRDAFRVLKAGGRLAISDIVATAELPEEVRRDLALYTGCMAGASQITELESMLHAAGFEQVGITPKDASRSFIRDWAPGTRIEELVVSANIEAVKP